MTVGELKKILESYSDNLIVVCSLEDSYFDEVDIIKRMVLKKDGKFYRVAPLDDINTNSYCVVLL